MDPPREYIAHLGRPGCGRTYSALLHHGMIAMLHQACGCSGAGLYIRYRYSCVISHHINNIYVFMIQVHMYVHSYTQQSVVRAIGVSHTACKCELRRNLRSHGWSVFLFLYVVMHVYSYVRTTGTRCTISSSLCLLFAPTFLLTRLKRLTACR